VEMYCTYCSDGYPSWEVARVMCEIVGNVTNMIGFLFSGFMFFLVCFFWEVDMLMLTMVVMAMIRVWKRRRGGVRRSRCRCEIGGSR
jgi:hypothetical protein